MHSCGLAQTQESEAVRSLASHIKHIPRRREHPIDQRCLEQACCTLQYLDVTECSICALMCRLARACSFISHICSFIWYRPTYIDAGLRGMGGSLSGTPKPSALMVSISQ